VENEAQGIETGFSNKATVDNSLGSPKTKPAVRRRDGIKNSGGTTHLEMKKSNKKLNKKNKYKGKKKGRDWPRGGQNDDQKLGRRASKNQSRNVA